MPRPPAAARARAPEDLWRRAALLGLSFTLALNVSALAGDILRGGAPAGQRGAPTAFGSNPAITTQARNNAKDVLARTTQSVQAVQAMQAAARAAALAGPNNLGPGLPTVPNGLAPGALQVAAGVPANLANPQPGENPALWTGANLPTQTTANGRTIVTVKQNVAQAVLNWKTLNVGKQTTLKFDQSAGGSTKTQWIAFNKITDPTGHPTQILGHIEGDGQAYIINQNGILFGGSSQVNLRSLTASALPINDNLITRGLLNNPDAQFLFSALSLAAGTKGPTPAFTPPAALTADGRSGDVVVQKGAQLLAPTTPEKVGGRITLVGANVKNEGTISTPDGQTILAAGLQVGFDAHPSSDPSLRGLDVFVGNVNYAAGGTQPPAGTATNAGLIEATRANVTMVGKRVEQAGVIESSTSTALNGRVDLLASYGATSNTRFDATNPQNGGPFNNQLAGTVELGVDSVIRILPETAETDRAVGTKLALPSQVNIQGQAVHFRTDSRLVAPNANVSVTAGNWVSTGVTLTALRATGGQIYFERGALLDVAGSLDVAAPISQNILTLQLRGAELAGSPLQRTGLLRGPKLSIDLRQSGIYNGFAWVGTPLADVSGYVGIIQRGVGELTTAGGTVNLTAGEAVIMQPGSKIDVSGGWVNFEAGMVETTRVWSGGVLYDLAKATPDRVYDGIYTGTTTTNHAKWGITKTFAQPLALTGAHWEAAYLHGADAGTITINAPSMALQGTLQGHAVQGPRQSNATTIALAKAGTLNLNFRAEEVLTPYPFFSPTPPKIVFRNDPAQTVAEPFAVAADGVPVALSTELKTALVLSTELFTTHGFGTLAIDNSDGTISVPEDVELKAPRRGSISFRAANLDIAGRVVAPGGTLDFSVFNLSPFTLTKLNANISNAVTPPVDPERGVFSLAPTATLSTAGLITDYRPGATGSEELPPLVAGGSISINAFTANLAPGSVIDVSGGVSISATGKRTYGDAGSITINAGRDPGLAWLLGGKLALGSTLRGFSGGEGGALTVQAPLIQVGGSLPPLVMLPGNEPGYILNGVEVQRDELLHLTPEFFTQGGFTSYTLNGLGKAVNAGLNQFLPTVEIAPGTVIRPVAESWLTIGAVGSAQLTKILKPEGLRSPVSLTFGSATLTDIFVQPSQNVLRGDIVMGAGARIETDAKASVTFQASTVAILGSIIAPDGTITITGANAFPSFIPSVPLPEFNKALPTVHLGPQSVLSTAGRVLLTPDAYGRRIGSVLAGGTITVSGNIVAEAGALLDVSGASGILDLPPTTLVQNIGALDALNGNRLVAANSGINAPLYRLHTVPTRVDSDAGAIILRGGQELFTDATLRGFAGGPSARGGSLSIFSGRFIDPTGAGAQASPLDINLIVQQSGSTLPSGFYPSGGTAIGQSVPGAKANLGLGHFAVSSFEAGGFDSLTLSGKGAGLSGGVGFSGPVSIKARRSLSVSDGGVIFADAAVFLEAPYVALGTPFQSSLLATQATDLSFPGPTYFPPSFGPGSLTVRASLIDVGNLNLQNIGRTTLIADGGDIRGNGTLSAAGSVELRAGQIYPTSASRFTISVYDPNIAVAASSTASNQVTLASVALPPGFGVGSPLLGSTVTAINGTSVTLAANANATIGANTFVTFAPGAGSVKITGSGERPLPLSAGGTLSIYASNIHQGGTLRAPLGTINLGWDGTGTSPTDYLTGAGLQPGNTVAVTRQLTLAGGSVTSVSAVDPRTGRGLIIPYGFNANGTAWIDPAGTDITSGGVLQKAVNLSAVSLEAQGGSLIDVRGGGDLYAGRWVTGNGGANDLLGTAAGAWSSGVSYTAGQLVTYQGATYSARRTSTGVTPSVSQDWTLVPQSYAVLPDYEANYAPYAPFNNRVNALNLAITDPGYVNTGLGVGSRVYLGASNGLKAGTYTLLPARYASLPGGVLVTPQAGAALGTFLQPEGASIVSGYRFNDLNPQQLAPAQATRFEVAPENVWRTRAQYDDFFANTFFADAARDLGFDVPRLPIDSGRVVLFGLDALRVDGDILGRSIDGGYGAEIDISTRANILITGKGGSGPAGTTVLDATRLSSFGADSILIGGTRQATAGGTTITVHTRNLEVDNAGSALVAHELILVAKDRLTLAPGAEIVQSGTTRGSSLETPAPLLLGDAATAGSGNGLLLRVSDVQVPVIRSSVGSQAGQAALANPPVLSIGAGASISGTALTLDSTYGTTLDPTAVITGQDLALNSGQISLQFDSPGAVPAIAGLMLSGPALQGLQSASVLSLLSYSSIDLYGTGTFRAAGSLALHAGEIRGFNNGGGDVTFAASSILLDNSAGGTGPGAVGGLSGGLVFDTGTLRVGAGAVRLDQFATVELQATSGVLAAGNGSLLTQGALTITAPVLTAAKAVNYAITSAGGLDFLAASGAAGSSLVGGLGATLSLTGTSLSVNSDITLPSGTLNLRATAGDLLVGNLSAARLTAGGTAQTFYDLTRYTDGGRIALTADTGSVTLGAQSEISIAAQPGGGNAGSVSISAANGTFALNGSLDGRGGTGGASGSFALDVNNLANVSPVDLTLNDASFNQVRTYRVRSGDVTLEAVAVAHSYRLSVDQGSITVTGTGAIDASGATGGEIDLLAFGNLTLQTGAQLSVRGDDFNNAGQGGTISVEAGAQRNGVVGPGRVDLQTGATLDLSVAAKIAGDALTPGTSAYLGQFSGKLHLRAPQNAAGTDLLVNPINATILDASSIVVEGYRLFDLTNTTGVITNSGTINAAGGLMTAGNNVQGSINASGVNFLGAAGTTTANYTAMLNRLLGADPQGLASVLVLAPGAEVIHRTGNLTLGATNSTQTSDWNLASFRYGAKRAPGTLTLRAAGNLIFFNALSDGFTPSLPSSNAGWMYQAELTAQNPLLPINSQSWSYRLTAGADFTGADFQGVRPLTSLAANAGSLQLGKLVTTNNGNPVATGGNNAQTSTALAQRYQVIRTGSGDITISAGRDVQLLNQFATIYTAGTRTADPTLGGNFEVSQSVDVGAQGPLGAVQQNPTYAAQYSLGGGNVTITAQQDIKHQTQAGGVLVADSQKQIPTNWLARRGQVDPETGEFALAAEDEFGTATVASTSWWVDFSNFFEGIGTLGGGNITLTAGRDVRNVDAAAPTNARMTFQTTTGDRLADNQTLLELGGGDITIRAGRNLDAGIYYVERGQGTLAVGGNILTNSTRSASNLTNLNPSEKQWLPTTLFLGKGGFDVSAAGDVLLGPTVNPFLLPVGLTNSFWRKSYFSTYAPTSEVRITSLGGTITLRQNSTPPNTVAGGATVGDAPILQNWMQAVHLLSSSSVSFTQPWLRLAETQIGSFSTAFSVLPGSVRATAFSGDINLVGQFNLTPSPIGTIELTAAGAINGLQPTGVIRTTGSSALRTTWTSAQINLSDADPGSIPGITAPLGYQNIAGASGAQNQRTSLTFLDFFDDLFAESGSSTGDQAVIQTQRALHGTSLLHAADSEPIRLYASGGNLSGLTLFSAKSARIVAERDISDVALYLQNIDASDISVVSAGQDIIAYNASSLLRNAAQSPGNLLNGGEVPLAGDLQISGPGTLQVLAGRNLDLGTGENNADGTGVGLTSIGNARNPNLPFAGADIIAAAGVGPAIGLGSSDLDFDTFLGTVLAGPDADRYLAEVATTFPDLAADLKGRTLDSLDAELRAKLALEIFYLVLRDAGRNYNVAGSPGFGNYDAGFQAITALFGSSQSEGNIITRSRDIRTRSGGNISLLAPGGSLTLATTTIGTPLAPPGIITEAGGNISIFADGNVDIGISRIFTLRGGNEIIWSSNGNIAAGASSKTVQSAPPTRVLIDAQSADLKTDLAGLATGGGIGVLATVGGVPPGSVDLIAPTGIVDAGDAGIQATGNLNIAALQVLNADNIQAGGTSVGVSVAPTVAAPNIGALTTASNTAGAASSAANEVANQQRRPEEAQPLPSIITVEVLGYGGGEDEEIIP